MYKKNISPWAQQVHTVHDIQMYVHPVRQIQQLCRQIYVFGLFYPAYVLIKYIPDYIFFNKCGESACGVTYIESLKNN